MAGDKERGGTAGGFGNYKLKVLRKMVPSGIMGCSMAIKVTRKDQNEANENIIRRFNRKVLQSGVIPLAKSQMRFSKPISKRERRNKAILREQRKAEKIERIRMGLK